MFGRKHPPASKWPFSRQKTTRTDPLRRVVIILLLIAFILLPDTEQGTKQAWKRLYAERKARMSEPHRILFVSVLTQLAMFFSPRLESA